jgi:hypothetical protein
MRCPGGAGGDPSRSANVCQVRSQRVNTACIVIWLALPRSRKRGAEMIRHCERKRFDFCFLKAHDKSSER